MTGRVRTGLGAAAVLLAVAALVGGPAAAPAFAVPPPGACLTQLKPEQLRPDRPWEDKLLDPSRVWRLTRGAGIRVGVVDSGVDSDNPQMRGKVFSGFDFVRNQRGARFDCAEHGTAVASIIVGEKMAGTGFHGVAPDARVVPARVTETDQIKGGAPVIAAAIRYTVDNGVKVLNLSLTLTQDDPQVKSAVDYAQDHDVLVVAAAGNQHDEGNPAPYPASYPGVLGVGSIDISGVRAPDSQSGEYVDLVAPGEKVTGCHPGQGLKLYRGTSFATPFVAGVAALVRSYYPKLTAQQVALRLIRTASVSRGGVDSPEYGAGLVDPYRAVTDTSVEAVPQAARPTPLPPQQPDLVAQHHAAAQRAEYDSAMSTAGLMLGLSAGGVLLGAVVLAGHRRGWVAARRTGSTNNN